MITHEGKKYRGISHRGGAFVFRYTDAQGCEHRIKCETLDEALTLYHTKKSLKRKGGMPAPVVLRRGKLTFAEIVIDAIAPPRLSRRWGSKILFAGRPLRSAGLPLRSIITARSCRLHIDWRFATARRRSTRRTPCRAAAKITAGFGISRKTKRRDCVRSLNWNIGGICPSLMWRSTPACGREASIASRGAW
jgi:hypothetical protein